MRIKNTRSNENRRMTGQDRYYYHEFCHLKRLCEAFLPDRRVASPLVWVSYDHLTAASDNYKTFRNCSSITTIAIKFLGKLITFSF